VLPDDDMQCAIDADESAYLPAPEQRTHKYMICCHNTHNNGILIILTRDFS